MFTVGGRHASREPRFPVRDVAMLSQLDRGYAELRPNGVLRSSAKVCSQKSMLAAPESGPRVPWIAKIFGPAKPLPLRVAIAGPSDKPRSCHNASACG